MQLNNLNFKHMAVTLIPWLTANKFRKQPNLQHYKLLIPNHGEIHIYLDNGIGDGLGHIVYFKKNGYSDIVYSQTKERVKEIYKLVTNGADLEFP